MGRIWEPFLTERDRQVFEAAGYGHRAGFGLRPALLVVDANYNFVGDRAEPILDSIRRWPNSCGEEGWRALEVIRRLLDAARGKGLPVFYTTGERRPDGLDAGGWAWKNRRTREHPQHEEDGNAIVQEIAPQPRDFVIKKQKPSAFFGTPLLSYLVDFKVDTLLVTGTTTSECVRATVVDAFSYNFRVAVVEDACFDRCQASHAMSLCDMHMKYADVVTSDETLQYIQALPEGLFDALKPGAVGRHQI